MKLQNFIYFLFFLLMLLAKTSNSQNLKTKASTLIVEYNKNIPVHYLSKVEFYPPLGGEFYNNLIPTEGQIDTVKNQIYLTFDQEVGCFFLLKYGSTILNGYIEPGETIKAKLPYNNMLFKFIDYRSEENNLYNLAFSDEKRDEIFNTIKQQLSNSFKNKNVFPWNDNESTLKEYVNSEWQHIIKNFVDLQNENKLSPKAFDAFSTALYAQFFRRTLSLLGEQSDYEKRKNLEKLFPVIFKDSISSRSILTRIPSGNTLLNAYAVYCNNDEPINSQDSSFMVFKRYYHYHFLTEIQQEYMLGRAFVLEKTFSSFNSAFDSKNAFSEYKRRYINSSFIPIISKIHDHAFGEVKVFYKSQKNNLFITKSNHASIIEFSDNKITIDTAVSVTSLSTFLKDYVSAKPVYIDFWATWCIPCLNEFKNSSTTKKLMDDNNIKMVYISLDKPESRKAWIDVIKYQKLEGLHLLVSEELNLELKKIYELEAIPRYMIFDSKGDVKNFHAPRPSALPDLIIELSKL